MSTTKRPRVLIIGAGFGGLYAARVFRDTRRSTSPSSIAPITTSSSRCSIRSRRRRSRPPTSAAPIRWLLRGQHNTEVVLAEVEAIDADAQARALRRRTGVELRLSHRRRRRAPLILRAPGMGADRAGAQERRGRDRAAAPLAHGVRARRAAGRPEPDRRRDRRQPHLRHRRRRSRPASSSPACCPTIAQVRAAAGFSTHRPRVRAHRLDRRRRPRCSRRFPRISRRAPSATWRNWASRFASASASPT